MDNLPSDMPACLTPFIAKNKMKQDIAVPCGKCPNCYARRSSQWSFRLMQEEKISETAHFITLTYDTKHTHITPNGFMCLNKHDVQLFFKKLRKDRDNQDRRIKYFAVGEYGGKTKRPHYHILCFNADLATFQRAWFQGSIHYGKVEGASIGYCLKYMSKPKRIPMHKNDDRTPEFALMSKGLGANYVTKKMQKWHLSDLQNRMYVNTEDGKKIAMPRYYKDRIYHPLQRMAVGASARKKMLEEEQKIMENPELLNQYFTGKKAAFEKMARDSTKHEKL